MTRPPLLTLLALSCTAKSPGGGADDSAVDSAAPEVPCDYAYQDADGDGYGAWDPDAAWVCPPPEGTVGNPRDCDDSDPSVFPSGAYPDVISLAGEDAVLPQALIDGCYDSLSNALSLHDTALDLSPLRSVGTAMYVAVEGQQAAALGGLEGLEDVGELHLSAHAAPPDLEGLRGLRRADRLELSDLPALERLSGLRALEEVQQLSLSGNNAAEGPELLAGLDSLERLVSLRLEDPGLQSFDALPEGLGLQRLTVRDTPIVSLAGLSWSDSAPVSVDLARLAELRDVEGLAGVATFGALHLSNLDRVETLSGLEDARSVEEDLWLCTDALLRDVSALHGLTSVGEGVLIADMPSLSQADADALIEAIGEENIGGGIGVSVSGGCD